MKKTLTAAALALSLMLTGISSLQADDHAKQALIILTSESLQTQGMAMVLGNAMQATGAQVDVLLCDKAGDLALKATESDRLKPQDVSPEMLLGRLMQNGANVNVCALYLPNSTHTLEDLRDGIGAAMPPAIGAQMLQDNVRVFSF